MYNAPVTYPTPPPAPPKTSNGLAIAGFVLGLLGFLGSFIPVLNIGGILLGLLGAILAAIGLSKAKKTGTGKGLALSGLILGLLAVIIGIIVNVAFAGAVNDALDEATDTTVNAPASSSDSDSDSADSSAESEGDAEVLGTSRDTPAPLGSAITGGDWTVTINSVETAEKDAFDQAAQAGSVLLVVNMTATYNGDDPQGSTPWASVNFVTADGTTVDGLDGSTLFVPEDQFDSLTTLYEGGSVTGEQMLEVPADNWESGVLVVSPDIMSDDTFVAVK